MTNSVRDVILGRWKFDDVPRLKPIRAAIDSALNAHDAVREKHASITENQHLSPLGRLDDVRSFVSKSTAPAIHRGRKTAISTRDELAKWKDRLKPATPDFKNVSAAVLRSEMRTHLRGLSQSARAALLLTDNPDLTLVQAVLEAPGFSSGVSDDMRMRMLEIVVNRDHPEELAWIAETEEALELLDAATDMVLSAAKSVSEFPSEKFFSDFIEASAPAAPATADDPGADVMLKELGKIAAAQGIKSIGPQGIEYHDNANRET
jgi:hypothetical protein